jgi:ATP-dependent protease ClpP protease subunit
MSQQYTCINGRAYPMQDGAIIGNAPEGWQATQEPAPSIVNIVIRGQIRGSHEAETGVYAAPIVKQIRSALHGSIFHLWLNSNGGNYEATFEIIEAFESRPDCRVIAHVEDRACSGAFLIMLCAEAADCEIAPGGRLMMHAVGLGDCIELTRDLTARCADYIARRRPNLPREWVAASLDHNSGDGVYLNAIDASRLGIVGTVWIDGKGHADIPARDRYFAHSGKHTPATCMCADCMEKRAGAPEPMASTKPEPIPLPEIPEGLELRCGFLLMSKRRNPMCSIGNDESLQYLREMFEDSQRKRLQWAMCL